MKTHNIGGSILPSNEPRILQPIPYRGGVLLVVPDSEADTHHLTFNGNAIATHPNGYSCHCLAERMAAGLADRTLDQARFIVDCGGSADFETIISLQIKP